MSERPTWVRWRVVGWLTVAAALAYLCRNAVGVAESTIRNELGLSTVQSGILFSSLFWTYSVLQVPAGVLAHRWGSRVTLAMFALCWAAGSILFGAAPFFWLLLFSQLLMGAAQAGLFPASCNTISHWMPRARRSLSCGILAAGMQVGAIGASLLTAALIAPVGWRWVFVLFAVPSLVWGFGFLVRFRNDPENDPAVNEAERELIQSDHDEEATPPAEVESREPTPWKAILTSRAMWLLCGQQICRAAGYAFFATWFPSFLQKTRDISVEDSGYLQGIVFAGTLCGSLFGGFVVDCIWKRTRSMRLSRGGVGAACLFLCGGLILAAFFVQTTTSAIALLAGGAFCAAIAGPCAFSSTIEIGGRHIPQVFGLMNMLGNFSALACPVIVGYLFKETENWNLVLVLFAVLYFIGSLCFAFVDPGKRISK